MASGFVQRFKGKVLASAKSLGLFGGASSSFGFCGNIASVTPNIGNGADTTEDTLFTFSLPAGSLDLPGRQLFVEAWGTFGNNADSKHARLYFGAEVVDSGANTTTGGIGWYLCLTVTKSGASAQSMSAQAIAGTVHGGCVTLTGAEADTAAITIKVTGQTGTANANDVVCKGVSIEALN